MGDAVVNLPERGVPYQYLYYVLSRHKQYGEPLTA